MLDLLVWYFLAFLTKILLLEDYKYIAYISMLMKISQQNLKYIMQDDFKMTSGSASMIRYKPLH